MTERTISNVSEISNATGTGGGVTAFAVERNEAHSAVKVITDVTDVVPLVTPDGTLAVDDGSLKFKDAGVWKSAGGPPPVPLIFVFDKRINVNNVGTIPTTIGQVNQAFPAATYQFGFSMSFTFPSTSLSVLIRFSLDGGATWTNFIRESGDTTDIDPFVYLFPFNHAGGTINAIVQGSKESGTPILNFLYVDTWIQQLTPST